MDKTLPKPMCIICALVLIISTSKAQTKLMADGAGNTYELINSVLAPGYDAVENAECAHPAFGRHIAEVWDDDLQKFVFEFYIHVSPDNDRCIKFDRQRVEIKTYEPSPENLKAVSGETVIYKWSFKIPVGFQPSQAFTHIHQIKAVEGDDADPLFVLTARKGPPDKLELNYYVSSDTDQIRLTSANLSEFENTWVEVTERIKFHNTNGTYSITIKNLKNGNTIMSYSNSKLLTIRSNNSFARPKWGIYRSLLYPSDLRDESIRFGYFSITEEVSTDTSHTQLDDNNLKLLNINDKTVLAYSLKEKSDVEIAAFGITGQNRQILVNEIQVLPGYHYVDIEDNKLSKGFNIISLKTEKDHIARKYFIQK